MLLVQANLPWRYNWNLLLRCNKFILSYARSMYTLFPGRVSLFFFCVAFDSFQLLGGKKKRKTRNVYLSNAVDGRKVAKCLIDELVFIIVAFFSLHLFFNFGLIQPLLLSALRSFLFVRFIFIVDHSLQMFMLWGSVL